MYNTDCILNIKHFIVYWVSFFVLSSCMYGLVVRHRLFMCYGNEGYNYYVVLILIVLTAWKCIEESLPMVKALSRNLVSLP